MYLQIRADVGEGMQSRSYHDNAVQPKNECFILNNGVWFYLLTNLQEYRRPL